MNHFLRAVCFVGLAFSMVIGYGSFTTASADRYYYQYDRGGYNNYRRPNYRRARYNRAYDYCASQFRVGGHRFQRCMDRRLYDNPGPPPPPPPPRW